MLRDAQTTQHGKDEKLMRHAVPPAEARRARDDLLAAFTAEALEELVYYESSTGPSQAALAVELPPVGLEESHGCAAASALRRCGHCNHRLRSRNTLELWKAQNEQPSLLSPKMTTFNTFLAINTYISIFFCFLFFAAAAAMATVVATVAAATEAAHPTQNWPRESLA